MSENPSDWVKMIEANAIPAVAFCKPASNEMDFTSFLSSPENFATKNPMNRSDMLSVTKTGPNVAMLSMKVCQPLISAATTIRANSAAPMSEKAGSTRIEKAGLKCRIAIPRSIGNAVMTKTASARPVIVTFGASAP